MLAINFSNARGITEVTSTTTKIQKKTSPTHPYPSVTYTPRRIHGRLEVNPLQLLPGLVIPVKINAKHCN